MRFTHEDSRPVGADLVSLPLPADLTVGVLQGYRHKLKMTWSVFDNQVTEGWGPNGKRSAIRIYDDPASFTFLLRAIHERSPNHAAWGWSNDACIPINQDRFQLGLSLVEASGELKIEPAVMD